MKVRSRWQILAVMACAVFLAAPAFAGDDGQGGEKRSSLCVLDGAWVGFYDSPVYGFIRWTAVHDPDSHWTGTAQLQFILADLSFGGLFPTVTWLSPTIGSWVRTGRRTYDYTAVSYGVDATGETVYIWKLNGTIELSGQCDALQVDSIDFELYSPDQDPFGSDPPAYACIPDGTIGFAQRIPVDPPLCEP